MSYFSFKPYVSVANRKVAGQKKIKALQKAGRLIEPVGELSHRTKIATSFWGNAWCKHLESLSDYANRLPRARSYVRNGSVLHLAIQPGRIEALVQGSELYQQTITITALAAAKWQTLQARSQGKIGSLIELLQGKISDEIMAVVTNQNEGLFPKPKEISLFCSCPDSAGLCKHLGAVLYGVGARLDSQPELLFKLRGVDHQDLISAVDPASVLSERPAGGSRRRVLDPSALGDVFGIDLGTHPNPAPEVFRTAPKPSAANKKPAAKPVGLRKKAPFEATAESIRALRAQLGLARPAMAAKLGISAQSVANWENKAAPLKLRPAILLRLQTLARDISPEH